MPSFELGDELSQIQSVVRDFARSEVRPALRRTEREGPSNALVDRFNELGLMGLDWPVESGGQGMAPLARALVEEELAFADLGTSFALDRGGAAAVFLGAARTGAGFSALQALLERGGSAAFAAAEDGKASVDMRTTATRAGSGWLLQGRKTYVLGGADTSLHVVLAQVDPGAGLAGAGAFLVEPQPGLSTVRTLTTLGLNAVPMREVALAQVRAAERLDEPGQLPSLLRRFYDGLALVSAARGVGVAGAAFEYARAYAEERSAFGKPIGHFQAIAFLLADMAIAVDAARWMVWRAAWAAGAGPATAELAAAQSQAMEAAFFCTNNAVQVLGGAGYVKDHPVEKWMRDAKTLALYGLHTQAADATLAAAELGQELTAPELFPLPSLHPSIA